MYISTFKLVVHPIRSWLIKYSNNIWNIYVSFVKTFEKSNIKEAEWNDAQGNDFLISFLWFYFFSSFKLLSDPFSRKSCTKTLCHLMMQRREDSNSFSYKYICLLYGSVKGLQCYFARFHMLNKVEFFRHKDIKSYLPIVN